MYYLLPYNVILYYREQCRFDLYHFWSFQINFIIRQLQGIKTSNTQINQTQILYNLMTIYIYNCYQNGSYEASHWNFSFTILSIFYSTDHYQWQYLCPNWKYKKIFISFSIICVHTYVHSFLMPVYNICSTFFMLYFTLWFTDDLVLCDQGSYLYVYFIIHLSNK